MLHVFFDKAKGRSAHTPRPFLSPYIFYLFVFKPLARGLGRSPKWGTEASVCPVGTCAKRKANRRSQPKRAAGTAVPVATIEVAGAKAE